MPDYHERVRFDCSDADEFERGIAAGVEATGAGELIVLPTDTVYGIGADAFSPPAVRRMLAAKGRGRNMPPPVLVSAPSDRKSTRLNSSHVAISYAVFCSKKTRETINYE